MAYMYTLLMEKENPELVRDSDKLKKLFSVSLVQLFNKNYLDSRVVPIIEKKNILVKEKINRNPNVVAWVENMTIFINPPEFFSKPLESQIKYILHEFMHILNNSKNFTLIKEFKEINDLSDKLWAIAKKHSKNIGMFLTGKDVKPSMLNSQEPMSYLMNNAIKWNQISPEGKKLFIDEIIKSGIFNVTSQFWKKRIG